MSNVNGANKDIEFFNSSFNFATMDGSILNMFLKAILFTVEFTSSDSITYRYMLNNENIEITAPIVVEGNKMTIRMSQVMPYYHDVEFYTFQDANNKQLHLYMYTTAFENFFANTLVVALSRKGELDVNDANAVANAHQVIDDAIEIINFSIVLKATR